MSGGDTDDVMELSGMTAPSGRGSDVRSRVSEPRPEGAVMQIEALHHTAED
jgi:hypothetical protein